MEKDIEDKLKELQSVLVEKYDLEKKIEKSPKELDSQDELLARLKKEYIEKNKSYEEVKSEVDRLKKELAEAESAKDAGEKAMDSITTHREYEALEKQISEASAKEASVRKDLVREEKKLEELDEVLRSNEALINQQESDLNESKDSLSKEIEGYKAELAALEKKESEIVPGLDSEIVYKFHRIIQRNSEGIVAVRNGVCTGCQMILPAQFANEVRNGEKILFCPYCSRILFYQEVAEDEVEDYSSLDETGSLADDYDEDFGDEVDEIEGEDLESNGDMEDEKSLSYE